MNLKGLKTKGIIPKYKIEKVNGETVDHNAEYFVLRLDAYGSDLKHITASRAALIDYACIIKDHLPELAKDIVRKYGSHFRPISEMTPTEARYILDQSLADSFATELIKTMSSSLFGLNKVIGTGGDFSSLSKMKELGFDVWFFNSWIV